MNKKKYSKMKRFFAILGVVVILAAFALPFSASAWEITDIHFYNYWDVSKFSPSTDDGMNAFIESIDPDTGMMRISAYYQRWGVYYVPWQYTRIKLKDICPEMKEGETYVLTVESTFSMEASNLKSLNQVTLCNSAWTTNINWVSGQSLTVTHEHLDAYVLLYYGKWDQATFSPGHMDKVYNDVRIWVNKDEAQEYAPYDLLGYYEQGVYDDIYNEGYKDGSNVGYTEGYKNGHKLGREEGYTDYISDKLIVSKNNITFTPYFADFSTTKIVAGVEYGANGALPLEYPFNGYSFRTSSLPSVYVTSTKSENKFVGFDLVLVPSVHDTYYCVGDSNFSFAGTNCKVVLNVGVLEGDELVSKSKEYTLREHETVKVDWFADYGLEDKEMIFGLSFSVRLVLPFYSELLWDDFVFAFTDMSGEGYEIGKQDGYDLGLAEGETTGYENGQKDGYYDGYEDGSRDGAIAGVERGKEIGYAEGYSKGKEETFEKGEAAGYDKGYHQGYTEGRTAELKKSSFYTLIYSVVDAPVQVIHDMLNFEFLGVNFSAFFFGLITFIAVASFSVWLIKFVK